MADFDDADPTAEDEFENEDEEMEDANEPDQDQDADAEQDDDAGGDDDEDDDQDNDDEEGGDEEEDEDQPESPSRRPSQATTVQHRSPTRDQQNKPSVTFTSASPHHLAERSPTDTVSWMPPPRPEALSAQSYDIVPTMAAPQSTSINAIAATPDMHWVFSGGTDGYIRMFNWVETANGKVPLTVAQKHPFVDSVMKAGSLLTYWENEDTTQVTPKRGLGDEDGKWTSPVYSLAVHHQAIWLLSGLESGGINLQTCRHQAGTRITTLKEHTSAVSVLRLSQDETQLLSGSWDKTIHDWDLNTGKVKRSFHGSVSQISAVETRPMSDLPIPEVSETQPESINGTFGSNNADKPLPIGIFGNGFSRQDSKGDDADAAGSPDGSLFGENDHGSLFGEDTAGGGGGGNVFGEDEDDLTRQLANGLQETDQDAPGEEEDIEMSGMGMGGGGPVMPPETLAPSSAEASQNFTDGQTIPQLDGGATEPPPSTAAHTAPLTNGIGLPHSDEPLTAPPTNSTTTNQTTTTSAADLPLQSESTFLSTSIDGTIRIWDRRLSPPIAVLHPHGSTPPWCTGACWSPDGNSFYVGRRNNTVEEYNIHKLSTSRNEPSRHFRFQAGSGPVYSVRAMPNSRHLVCASQDILRIYDLKHDISATRNRGANATPFTIVPGHRGGVISDVYVDPSCRFMLSAAGNRGWDGFGTEVLLGYEIGCG